MALTANGTDGNYLTLTSTQSSTNFWFTALFRTDDDDPAGEQDLIAIHKASPYAYLQIAFDVSGTTRDSLRLATESNWEVLTGTGGLNTDWFGFGMSCSGVGATDLLIIYKATPASSPVTFSRQMTGGTFTPDWLRIFSGMQRAGAASVQNVKYGVGTRTLAQLEDELWTTTNVYTTGSPLLVPMVTGVAASQATGLTIVGTVTTTVGPLDTTGGTAPTITVSSASVEGDDLTVSGTYTGDGGGLAVTIQDLVSSAVTQTITPAFSSGTFSSTFRANTVGSHTIRALIADSNGTDSDDSSALSVVGFSGADELPYSWAITSLTITPSTITVPLGGTSQFTVRDQAGNIVRGAGVSYPGIASGGSATDISGQATVTGNTTGTGQITAQALNYAGGTVTANAALTVGTVSVAVVTVSPSVASVAVDETITFSATVTGSVAGVTWSVVSGGGSISSAGVYTPATAGAVVIRATSIEFGASSGDADLTVTAENQSTGFSASFISDATQSAQVGAVIAYTIVVRNEDTPVSGATVTVTPSAASNALTITEGTTDANGRATVNVTVLDGAPVDVTIVLSFLIETPTAEATILGYLQILSELYGATELRGVTYARPRPRNE